MEMISWLPALGIILLLALMVYWMITSAKKEVAKKAQIASSLGFAARNPDPALLDQLLSVYPRQKEPAGYQLKNVFRKPFPDGEIFIFDLIDTSGEDNNQIENQTIAIFSSYLQLPHFALYPQADTGGLATNLANRVMQWAVGHYGVLLEFPESPEFNKKYLLASLEPDVARNFFTPQMLHRLAQTSLLTVNARGDLFTLSNIDPARKAFDQSSQADRVDKAMLVFTILQEGNPPGSA